MDDHQNTEDELAETKQTLAALLDQLANTQRELAETRLNLSLLQVDFTALTNCNSMTQPEEIEISLRSSLESVEHRKVSLRQELNIREETRLCVICLEHEKNVVLWPCGHMFICEHCSQDLYLRSCPMCRRSIEGRTKVFL
jgi:hypothetical protein